MRIVFGDHALANLIDRKLERAWVERVLAHPDAVEADPKHMERRRAFGSVPELEGRFLRVVFVPGQDEMKVVTVFLDRARGKRHARALRHGS